MFSPFDGPYVSEGLLLQNERFSRFVTVIPAYVLLCVSLGYHIQIFDKDNIPAKAIRSLKSYMENPQFQPDEVAKVIEKSQG